MSSINIKKFTCSPSGENIKMEVVYEANFTESEVRLDVGFVPTLVVTPGAEYLSGRYVGAPGPVFVGGKSNAAANYRKEVYLTLPTIRPASNTRITRTETVETAKANFWLPPLTASSFGIPNAAIEARIHLDPEVYASRAPTCTSPLAAPVTATPAAPVIDTTDDLKGTITAQGENGSAEGKEKVFDNQQNTKWLDLSPQGSWIQYAYAAGIAGRLTGYTITSANDCPERDPANWQLLGSNDGGASWATVDSQTGVTFNARFQKLAFTVSGTPTYKIYRLNITKVLDPSSANSVQLAEIELLGQQVPG